MEISYDTIKPLIKKEEITADNQIHIEFQAKNQSVPLTTVAFVVPDEQEIKKQALKQAAKSTVKNSLINQLLGFLGIRGVGRRLAREVIDSQSKKNASSIMKTSVTQEKKEEAVVNAFKQFSAMYKYNEQTGEWEYTANQ